MTFSLLARDFSTGALGGAAATGSLCVGGWVLRGDSRRGMSASQGAAPSTFWGEEVLQRMAARETAEAAVAAVTRPDGGRDWRQLSALDPAGGTAAFTGTENTDWRGSLGGDGLVLAGNLLSGPEVLEAARDAFLAAKGAFAERLIAALAAGEAAGGDSRGLQSAALLVVSDETAPLTLRVDWDAAPVAALGRLFAKTQEEPYASWYPQVPCHAEPERVLKD